MANSKIKSVLVVTVSGEHQFFGPDGVAVFNELERASETRAEQTAPIWLDDSFEQIRFTMQHVVNYTARHSAAY